MMAFFLVFACLLRTAHGSSVRKPNTGIAAATQHATASVAANNAVKVKTQPVANAAVQSHPAPKNVTNSTVVAVKDPLEIELGKAEDEVQAKEKEMKVQVGLLKEKEVEANQAQKRAVLLRGRVEKLQKEAEVAEEMAQEKSEAASKMQIKMNSTELKAQQSSVEEREMERVVNQTRKEELALEHNVSMIQQLVKMKKEGKVATPASQAAKQQELLHKSGSQVQVAKGTQSFLSAGTKVAAVTGTTDSQLNEAYKKLMEENGKLKHDKAMLEQQLNARAAATEKKKLKQKLKNRLALADRHMKMKKSLSPVAY